MRWLGFTDTVSVNQQSRGRTAGITPLPEFFS